MKWRRTGRNSMSKAYDAATTSRLEPSLDQVVAARALREKLRSNGYVIVYNVESRSADMKSMAPGVLKRMGIQQKRLLADDKAAWTRLSDVIAIMAERAWLRAGLDKADAAHKTNSRGLFEEALRLFPGSRFVERRKTHC